MEGVGRGKEESDFSEVFLLHIGRGKRVEFIYPICVFHHFACLLNSRA